MKIPHLAFCFAFFSALGRGESVVASSPAPEAAQVAHALVFGSIWHPVSSAVSSEVTVESVSDFAATFRDRLTRDPGEQRRVSAKAYVDTFGRPLPEQGFSSDPANGSYAELVAKHVEWLKQHPDEYRSLLNRAYLHVVRREPYEEEVTYWQSHGVLPYFLLVASLEDWARRNQPGLMVTTGTPTISINSIYLQTLRLTPGCAEQARSLVGIPTQTSSDASFASHRTIVAPSAGRIVSNGGIHFLCVGAPDLVSSRTD